MGIFRRVKSFFSTGATKRAEQNLNRRLAELKATPTGPKPLTPGPTPTENRLMKLADLARDARTRVSESANAATNSSDKESEKEEEVLADGPANDLEAFLYFRHWINVQSSNVFAIQYVIEDKTLNVEYKDASVYEYFPVAMEIAEDFITAPSKGKWVWDHLRVRGTVFGFKVPYRLVSYPHGYHKVVGKANRRPKGGRRTGGFVKTDQILMTEETRAKIEAAQNKAFWEAFPDTPAPRARF